MFDRKVLIAGTSDSSTAVMQNISYDIKDITDYRTRCRQFSCATAVEHRILHRISLYKYGIVCVINRCQRMIHIDQHRMDSRLDSFRCISSHAKKFDHASHLVGIFDIRCRDFGDSFGIYIIKSHSGIESCTGKNPDLPRPLSDHFPHSRDPAPVSEHRQTPYRSGSSWSG